jgi:MFS family permease
VAFAGYSVLGGIGAGLVYATCINMVGKWYPEKRGARTAFVNGGFAYGAVPFIYAFAAFLTPADYSAILDVMGVYMLVAVGIWGSCSRTRRRAGGRRTSTRSPGSATGSPRPGDWPRTRPR